MTTINYFVIPKKKPVNWFLVAFGLCCYAISFIFWTAVIVGLIILL